MLFERPLDNGWHELVLEDEVLDAIDGEDEDDEDGKVLDPRPLNELPEPGAVSMAELRPSTTIICKKEKNIFVLMTLKTVCNSYQVKGLDS